MKTSHYWQTNSVLMAFFVFSYRRQCYVSYCSILLNKSWSRMRVQSHVRHTLWCQEIKLTWWLESCMWHLVVYITLWWTYACSWLSVTTATATRICLKRKKWQLLIILRLWVARTFLPSVATNFGSFYHPIHLSTILFDYPSVGSVVYMRTKIVDIVTIETLGRAWCVTTVLRNLFNWRRIVR